VASVWYLPCFAIQQVVVKNRTTTGRNVTGIILLRLDLLFLLRSSMFESVVYRGEERPAEGRNDDD
jgi:hypothetical protein